MQSCCPVTTPSHTVFPVKVWPGHKNFKNTIQKCLSAQTNKFHFTCQKIYFPFLLGLMPPPFFSSSSSFFFKLIFVIGEFEVKRVYIDGQTLDGILLILWCIVIIQTFKCWQRIRQQKNQQRNFIFPNVIPHTEKSVVSFNSEGYDRDTHIQP